MGRLLDLARETEDLALLPKPTKAWVVEKGPVTPVILPHTLATAEPPFDALASAVLGIIVQAGQPVKHLDIVKALMGQGYDKTSARQAIARCQKWRWIEHDLETGYILA